MGRRSLSVDRRLQRLESVALSAYHTGEHDLQRRQGEWYTRFLHTLSVVDLERLEHWGDGHLCDTEEREVTTWYEARVQTYIDGTGDSPPTATGGNQG